METAIQKLHDAVEYVNKHHPLPRCEHDNCLQDHSGEQLEPPCGCHLTTPQETPARQQESLPFKLPLSVGRMPIHGSKIVDADGSLLVHDVYRHDIAEALVKATNRDPAFQKLVEVARQVEAWLTIRKDLTGRLQAAGDTRIASISSREIEILDQAREALRLAREGEE